MMESTSQSRQAQNMSDTASENPEHIDPDSIGHETCPICIVDFEAGDDLRVLPCEGKHRFHQTCVDPWLLEMSSSCPLCREDFHTLESMVQGVEPQDSESGHGDRPGLVATPHADGLDTTSGSSRSRSRRPTLANPSFSKYLRFAQRRRMRRSPSRDRGSDLEENSNSHTST